MKQSRIVKWEEITNPKKKIINRMTVVHPRKVSMF